MASLPSLLLDLELLAPAGFYIGLHVCFSAPAEEFNHLPPAWIDF